MNKQQVKGNWNTLVGRLKQKYGETFNDLDTKHEGDFDEIKGRLQHLHGTTKEEAHQLLEEMTNGDSVPTR